MDDPAVRCGECGTVIDEPPNTPPSERQPCPKCGSRSRRISASASDQLRVIGEAYAKTTAASNERIRRLVSAQAQAAITGAGSSTFDAAIAGAGLAAGTAHDATVKTESAIAAELTAEREQLTQSAIQILIRTVQIGQAESAKAAEQLHDLTVELVKWTRRIGWATFVAGFIGVAALAVAIVVAIQGAAKP